MNDPITLTSWQLILVIVGSHIAIQFLGAVISVIKWYHKTCPRKRKLPLSGMQVRCDKLLDHGECPQHGKVR